MTDRVRQPINGPATDSVTGAVISRRGRDTLHYEQAGRGTSLYVESDVRGMTVWFADHQAWDDGTAMSTTDRDTAREAIAAVGRHWNCPQIDFR